MFSLPTRLLLFLPALGILSVFCKLSERIYICTTSIKFLVKLTKEIRGEQPEGLENDLIDSFKSNVVGNIHLFNLYLPLILKGRVKKVIAISSGMADHEITLKYSLDSSAPYSISKAAMNTAVVKFSTQYGKDGVLFFSICPGTVNTGHWDNRKNHVPLQSLDGALTVLQLLLTRCKWLAKCTPNSLHTHLTLPVRFSRRLLSKMYCPSLTKPV